MRLGHGVDFRFWSDLGVFQSGCRIDADSWPHPEHTFVAFLHLVYFGISRTGVVRRCACLIDGVVLSHPTADDQAARAQQCADSIEKVLRQAMCMEQAAKGQDHGLVWDRDRLVIQVRGCSNPRLPVDVH